MHSFFTDRNQRYVLGGLYQITHSIQPIELRPLGLLCIQLLYLRILILKNKNIKF